MNTKEVTKTRQDAIKEAQRMLDIVKRRAFEAQNFTSKTPNERAEAKRDLAIAVDSLRLITEELNEFVQAWS